MAPGHLPVQRFGQCGDQAVRHRLVGRPGGERVHEQLPSRVKSGRDGILLRGKVAVKRPDRRPRRTGDLLDRGLGEATLREQADGHDRYLQQRLLLEPLPQWLDLHRHGTYRIHELAESANKA